MSDPNENFEEHLRSLQPARPSHRLESAIAADLARDAQLGTTPDNIPRRLRISLWTSWSITAIAATIAIVVLWGDRARRDSTTVQPKPEALVSDVVKTPAADSGLRLTPVSADGVLYGADFEGIVWIDDGVPARRMRYQFLDTVEMRDPDSSASVAFTYPREEIRFIPINAY